MTESAQPDDEKVSFSDLFDAAREIVCAGGDGGIVGISDVLDGLEAKFGDQFRVSKDTYRVLALITALWDDPHVNQVPGMWDVEFFWNAAGSNSNPDPAVERLMARMSEAAVSRANALEESMELDRVDGEVKDAECPLLNRDSRPVDDEERQNV